MQIQKVSIRNFRRLTDFDLELGGEDAFLIAENAGGKSSVLTTIARAMGRDLGFVLADFSDPAQPIEIIVTLFDLDLGLQGVFAERIEFGQPITLQMGVQARWDQLSEQVELTHGYPRHAWVGSSRDQRDALPLIWLPASREPARLLAFGGARSVLSMLVDELPLGPTLQQALAAITQAAANLAADASLRQLLDNAGADLEAVVPSGGGTPFDVGITATTDKDLLRQFALLMAYRSPAVPVGSQSSGLGQLAVFSFVAQLLAATPGAVLLVDEPEISLHPQAQRALIRLLTARARQSVLATHSSNVLDGINPRQVVRLADSGNGVEAWRPQNLSDAEATRLARLSTPLTAETFFARKVIFVEGISDVLALRAMAERHGRSFDAEGVTILSLEGGGGFETYLTLLGSTGLGLEILGLCDADQEQQWTQWIEAAGLGVGLDRAAMEALGFFVCDRDLEDELIQAVGVPAVEQIIAAEGEQGKLAAFCAQAQQQQKPPEDQIRSFLGARGRKARYAPLLVDALPVGAEPRPLLELLGRV